MSIDDITPAEWDAMARNTRNLESMRPEAPAAPKVSNCPNPKQAFGDLKAPMHLVPQSAIVALAESLRDGGAKYGPFNWREDHVELMTYMGATMRHMAAWIDGEDIDPDSGNNHLWHAMASLAIAVDAMACETCIDNRPVKGASAKLLSEAKERQV